METNIQRAQAAAQQYGNITLKGKLFKKVRRAGGSEFFFYALSGTPDAEAAYEAVMSPLTNKAGNSLFIRDAVTGKILFPQPNAANGLALTVNWTSGNPDVNPNGRFVVDDLMASVAGAQAEQKEIGRERAKILAARSLGLAPQLSEPRGNTNVNENAELSSEEVELAMRGNSEDAQA